MPVVRSGVMLGTAMLPNGVCKHQPAGERLAAGCGVTAFAIGQDRLIAARGHLVLRLGRSAASATNIKAASAAFHVGTSAPGFLR